ncbi:MAG: adenylate/guanylate cyclase domain-containing protein [Cyanobacteria bacterium SID2]|nr:adenylate/guanylate cyclase domain-containing protein [Cyanobacteria bacterium SID2]MBP0006252.1 adenylate/guanylate cyclase domain-containing protein [Cyanobacteria bacterium SBC]
MTSASPKTPAVDTEVTIDVQPQYNEPKAEPQNAASSSALATTKGSFGEFLAPLSRDKFADVVRGVEDKLRVVNQTLGMLDSLLESQGFDAILDEMLRSIALKTGELLHADRTTIFLLDEEKNELFTIVAKDEKGNALEIRFPATAGIAGESATFKRIVNIPYDFYDDPRSETAKKFDKKNNYRTYTMLTMPLLNEETENLVAVVQLINKLRSDIDADAPLDEKIDRGGFTEADEQVFREFAPSIRLILESSKSFYAATQKQRAASALMSAVNSLSKSSLDLEDTLKRVMDEAKELMNADRSTLWLLDDEKGELWTKIPGVGELRIPRNAGFAGMVAESGEPLLIPFDLYDDPRSETSKKTDRKTRYRTCSMLCMPVFNSDNHLIGVTQLINKKKQGEFPDYDPDSWPEPPEQWKSSFNRTDMEFMQAFNIQAGVALQNAKLFETVKQQEQRQKDILRSLTNGVISTDKQGRIIAANESAKILLGFGEDEGLEDMDLREMVHLQEGRFAEWFEAALQPKDDKDCQQYYPNQILQLLDRSEGQSVNLTINSMADASDPSKVNGALVVLEDISDEMEVKNLMYKYMTPEVAESLLASGDTGLGGKRKHVSVLFSDIRSYTTLTEKLEPEEVVTMLNEYFEEMVDAVFKYGGTLDKYIGDALMAVFGSPAPLEDREWCAIQAAVAMRQRLENFNEKRCAKGKMAIQIGMGIHSDRVVSGNIGSSKRMELTSIGDGVNLASRLEGTSKQYGTDIVISEQTYQPNAHRLAVRELDFITVKGKTQPVTIYEVVAVTEGELARPLSETQQQIIDRYHQGRHCYLQPAREKLGTEDFIPLLEQLEEMSEEELQHLSYNDEKVLRDMLANLPRERLIAVLGVDTLKRLLMTEDLDELADSDLHRLLPFKLKQLTPRLVKKLFVEKLQQFSSSEETQKMLAEEASEISLAKMKKLIDLAKRPLKQKTKQWFHQAREAFQKVLELDPKNKAAKLHVERCMLFEQQPPGEDWDGVWKLTDK